MSLYPENVHSYGTTRSGWRLAAADPSVGQMEDSDFSTHYTCMCQLPGETQITLNKGSTLHSARASASRH